MRIEIEIDDRFKNDVERVLDFFYFRVMDAPDFEWFKVNVEGQEKSFGKKKEAEEIKEEDSNLDTK